MWPPTLFDQLQTLPDFNRKELAMDLEQQGVGLPLLLRFSEILRSRIESLSQKFGAAIRSLTAAMRVFRPA